MNFEFTVVISTWPQKWHTTSGSTHGSDGCLNCASGENLTRGRVDTWSHVAREDTWTRGHVGHVDMEGGGRRAWVGGVRSGEKEGSAHSWISSILRTLRCSWCTCGGYLLLCILIYLLFIEDIVYRGHYMRADLRLDRVIERSEVGEHGGVVERGGLWW